MALGPAADLCGAIFLENLTPVAQRAAATALSEIRPGPAAEHGVPRRPWLPYAVPAAQPSRAAAATFPESFT